MADYQVAVLYDGKKLIPGPRWALARDVQRSPDGTARQRGWKITLSGEVAAFAGSPRNDGTFWDQSGYPPDETPASNAPELRVRNLRNKLGAIAALFDVEGRWLEIQPGDGSASLKAQVRTAQVKYDPGLWFQTVPFSIECDADKVFFGATEVASLGQADCVPEESWAVEPVDDTQRAYKLVHSVSAAAKKRFDDDGTVLAQGWEVARDLVLGGPLSGGGASLLGFDQDFLTAAGVLDLTTYRPYDYLRTQQVDEAGGRFAVTETWKCVDPGAAGPTGQTAGKALEDLTVETRYSLDTGLTSVTASGVITGLEERDPATRGLTKTRYDNAAARLAAVTTAVVLAAAQDQSGVALNPTPVSTVVTRNKVTGVIQYATAFDTRVGVTAGYLSESYEASVDLPANVVAEIGVIDRPAGPVLQPTGSTTRRAVTLTASIVLPTAYGQPLPAMPAWDPLPAALEVIGSVPDQIWLVADRVNVWNQRQGRFSRTATFIYQ
jgi:hypothetical protein